ncbi:MAG: hypothetical protein IKY27_00430 [Bacteroidales bacterium]|nr:hypothetical protein [Bacteroidales bacterium]MBR5780434.1 hypothetical protein [Bacteroidales bacterium]
MMKTTTSIRTYSELIGLPTFEERFRYLKLSGRVGEETFGRDRYINQLLYQRNRDWKHIRNEVIIRDNGCDLGCEGHEIHGLIIVHHMNPITIEDVLNLDPKVFDPEFLISTMHRTHNAIHYGNADLLITAPIERRKNDTCPWRH